MDLDKAFASALVHEGREALFAVIEKGINDELLLGDGKKVFEFVKEYNSKYGSFPTKDIVRGKLGVDLDNTPHGKVDFFADEIMNRDLHVKIREGLKNPIQLLEERDPKKALAKLEELMFTLRKSNQEQARIQSLPGLGKDVWDHYQKMKSGARGVPTPWPTLNEATLGLWPEDLVVLAARTGVGKTWATTLIADHAWSAGHKVLFCTTEISSLRIAMRFFALRFKLSYDALRKGALGSFAEEEFKKSIDSIINAEGLFVVGGGFDFRIETFAASIDDSEPDLVIMDGAYLLKVSGSNRTEQAANSFNELKRLCKKKKVPIVVTTQFNRDAKKNVGNSIKLENIALTDVAGWNADLIFGLLQTDDMRRDKRLVVKPMKVRDAVCDDIEINWDLEKMDFSELPKSASRNDADEFGTGLDPFANNGTGVDVPF